MPTYDSLNLAVKLLESMILMATQVSYNMFWHEFVILNRVRAFEIDLDSTHLEGVQLRNTNRIKVALYLDGSNQTLKLDFYTKKLTTESLQKLLLFAQLQEV
ncbi:hypothetical protein J14TS2_48870 [Bacillus sp. J14TS2]|nr:hypothetical protein J14TS2_48870 [Bacillus sp. J14TS2]